MKFQVKLDEGNYYDYEIDAPQNVIDQFNEELNLKDSNKAMAGKGYFSSKKSRVTIEETAKRYAAMIEKASSAPETNGTKSGRFVTTLDHAETMGYEHGRSWVATDYDVENGKVPAGFEGERVCYVYNK